MRSRPRVEELTDHHDPVAGALHERVEAREALRELNEDIAALPLRQRAAFVLYELSGLPHAAVGEAIGTTDLGARQLLHEARTTLEEFRAGRGLDCSRCACASLAATGASCAAAASRPTCAPARAAARAGPSARPAAPSPAACSSPRRPSSSRAWSSPASAPSPPPPGTAPPPATAAPPSVTIAPPASLAGPAPVSPVTPPAARGGRAGGSGRPVALPLHAPRPRDDAAGARRPGTTAASPAPPACAGPGTRRPGSRDRPRHRRARRPGRGSEVAPPPGPNKNGAPQHPAPPVEPSAPTPAPTPGTEQVPEEPASAPTPDVGEITPPADPGADRHPLGPPGSGAHRADDPGLRRAPAA